MHLPLLGSPIFNTLNGTNPTCGTQTEVDTTVEQLKKEVDGFLAEISSQLRTEHTDKGYYKKNNKFPRFTCCKINIKYIK